MTYEVVTNFDSRIPSWAGNGTPFTLVACHDTEGGQGRAGALGTIQFLIDTPWRGASYHEIWWYHEDSDEFGVIQIVHPSRAAGSIGPQPNIYLPTQWVKDSLGAGWWDPNQGVYAVSIAGRVADVDRYAQNPRFLAHAHRRMSEIRRDLGIHRRAEHFQFQPTTRSDWGLNLTPALGGLVIPDELPVTEDTTMDWIANMRRIDPLSVTVQPQTSFRLRPDLSAESSPWVPNATVTVVAIGIVAGEDFGAGPNWYVMASANGGLRVFHTQDAVSTVALGVPTVDTGKVAELEGRVAELTATVTGQTQVIADLKTALGEAEVTVAEALTRVEAAEETASEATALRAALVKFLN